MPSPRLFLRLRLFRYPYRLEVELLTLRDHGCLCFHRAHIKFDLYQVFAVDVVKISYQICVPVFLFPPFKKDDYL